MFVELPLCLSKADAGTYPSTRPLLGESRHKKAAPRAAIDDRPSKRTFVYSGLASQDPGPLSCCGKDHKPGVIRRRFTAAATTWAGSYKHQNACWYRNGYCWL